MSYKRSNHATIYTDGACSRNGQGDGAKAGIGVYWGPDSSNNISQPIGGRQTNQRAEIIAADTAIQQAKAQGYDKVTIKTDSQYVKNAAESWIPKWESGGWTKDVVNKQEFQSLRQSMRDIDVKFEHVPSGSNAADGLAKSGSTRNNRY